jgi:hypothetical protein
MSVDGQGQEATKEKQPLRLSGLIEESRIDFTKATKRNDWSGLVGQAG